MHDSQYIETHYVTPPAEITRGPSPLAKLSVKLFAILH